VRDLLASKVYLSPDPEDAQGRVHYTYQLLVAVEKDYEQFLALDKQDKLNGESTAEKLFSAVAGGLLEQAQADAIASYDDCRYDCLLTDAFDAKLAKCDVRPVRPEA
jgi:acyl-CoA dehydrogenase